MSVVLRPDADGTGTLLEWESSDADRYNKINDSNNATFISTSDISLAQHHSRFTKPACGIPAGATIQSVKLTLTCKRVYTGNPTIPYVNHGLYIGGADFHGANVNVASDVFTDYSKTWTLSPATGLPFTIAEIDAMEICFTGNSNRKFILVWWYTSVDCSEAYLTITYVIPNNAGVSSSTVILVLIAGVEYHKRYKRRRVLQIIL